MIRVLLVANAQVNRSIATSLSQQAGQPYQLSSVSSYAAGLEHLRTQPTAICLFDQQLNQQLEQKAAPDTGLKFCQQLRQAGEQLPCIMLCDAFNQDSEEQALHSGANAILDKQQLSTFALDHSIRICIERQALEQRSLHHDRLISIGTISASIAHQFNNIDTAIIGNLEIILRQTDLDEMLRKRLQTIMQSLERASYMSHALLGFSRSQSNTHNPQTDSLDHAAKDVALLLNADKRQCPIIVAYPASAQLVQVPMQRHLIEQVIFNLAVNARHACAGSTNPSIIIETGVSDNEAYLRITDNGCGISPAVRAHMFDAFYTTKNSATPDTSADENTITGTGLGLSLCHSIIQQHAGRISVDSTPGHGSCFTIWLPR